MIFVNNWSDADISISAGAAGGYWVRGAVYSERGQIVVDWKPCNIAEVRKILNDCQVCYGSFTVFDMTGRISKV